MDEKENESTQSISITLLHISGEKVTVSVDDAFMGKHSQIITSSSSFSVYQFKHCILADWNEKWGPAPPSPSYIRLIFLGKVLDDSNDFESYKFSRSSKNILHLSVKPIEFSSYEPELIQKEGTKCFKCLIS